MPHLFERLIQLQQTSEISSFVNTMSPGDGSVDDQASGSSGAGGATGDASTKATSPDKATDSVPPPAIGGLDIVADFVGNHMGSLQVHSEVSAGCVVHDFYSGIHYIFQRKNSCDDTSRLIPFFTG